MHGLGPGDDPERAEHERHRSAATAAHAGIGPGRERENGERDEAADEVIAGRRARRRLEEAVVEHVQRDRGDAEHEQSGLAREARARDRQGGIGLAKRAAVAVVTVAPTRAASAAGFSTAA